MLYRKCNHDRPFRILFGSILPTVIIGKRTTDKRYIVVNDEDIELETDSLSEAEEKYLELCEAAHSGSVGKYLIGKHKLVAGKVKVIN